jgi:hypothetical protein
MALFKTRISLDALLRPTLAGVFHRDYEHALSAIGKAAALPPEDLAGLKRELLAFEVALWHLLFFQAYGTRLGAEELMRRFTIALALAHIDAGATVETVETTLERTIEVVLSYQEGLYSHAKAHHQRAGPAFAYCQQFTARVLPALDVRLEADQSRHFQVFDIAQQTSRSIEQLFAALHREHRVVVS